MAWSKKLAALGQDLLNGIDRPLTRVLEQARAEVPEYAAIPIDALRAAAEPQWRWCVTASFVEGRKPTPDELELFDRGVEVRARQGISFEALVLGTRRMEREVWAEIFPLAQQHGIDNDALRAALESWNELLSSLISRAAATYRRIEHEAARHDEQRRAHFLHGVLLGTMVASEITSEAAAHGLSAERAYVTFRSRGPEDELRALQRSLAAETGGPGVMGIVQGDLAGLLPSVPTREDLALPVGVGPKTMLPGAPASFRLATRALEAAAMLGIGGVSDLERLGLRAAVVADDNLGEILERRYVRPIVEGGAFGRMLLETLRVLFRNGMRVDATARELVIHPNTLRHRLRRYEELTSADLTSTETLLEVWWALERDSLGKR